MTMTALNMKLSVITVDAMSEGFDVWRTDISLKGDKKISGSKFNNALVLGGTGMLAEASAYIASISSIISLGARNPEPLAGRLGAVPLILDWTDQETALCVLQNDSKYDLIVSWVHDEALEMIEPMEKLLVKGGRSIRVHGCESADPITRKKRDAGTRTDINRQTVVLGWINETGARRWLSHDEISAGVIRAVQNSGLATSIVGVVE
jgi:hypothetical protein